MSEPKLILAVQIDDNNHMTVKLGTHHEALLALALRKAQLTVDNVLLETEMDNNIKEASPIVQIPNSLLDKI